MSSIPVTVTSYLNKFSTSRYNIEWNKTENISNVIVVPAVAEYDNIKVLLHSLAGCDPSHFRSTLILLVINNPASAESHIIADNKQSLQLIRSLISGDESEEFNRLMLSSGLQVGVIDASSAGKELDENNSGVGLARKIGMDLALTVFDYNLDHKKIITCLDADCKVSENYITSIADEFNNKDSNAAVINFKHNIEEDYETNDAVICYELFLRYYVEGLKYAGSDYAFHTIGSAMMCDHSAYIKIGGMNKRKAAEDFYFLEKLSKLYNIDNVKNAEVYPSGRKSWRVPFGTGQRVTRFLANTHNEYLLFDPEIFELLKAWLLIYNSGRLLTPEQFLVAAKDVHEEIYYFLIKNNFEEQWERILSNTKSERQLLFQKKIWFDGFKTLKLVHHLRDTAFPNINMFDALDKMIIMLDADISVDRMGAETPPQPVQAEYLEAFREFNTDSASKTSLAR